MIWINLKHHLVVALIEYLDENGLLSLFAEHLDLDQGMDQYIPMSQAKKTGYQYQTIIAIKLFNMAKKWKITLPHKSALEFANDLSEYLPTSSPLFLAMEILVTGAGFINFRMVNFFPENVLGTDGILAFRHNAPIPVDPKDYRDNKLEHIVVDFSSPNIAKPLHVGHLRSTIIGNAISNILEYQGYTVNRQNHLGDWGTPIGKLIQSYLEKNKKESLSDFNLEDLKTLKLSLPEMSSLYCEGSRKFSTDPEFKKKALAHVVKLQGNDLATKLFWEVVYNISLRQLETIYEKLGVTNHYAGESTYGETIPHVLEDYRELITKDEQDRVILDVEMSSPLILIKSDGSYTYDTTDLAALEYRINSLGSSRIIYVVDSGQSHHFQQLFKASNTHNILKTGHELNVSLEHKKFGLVLGLDGKKISSRALPEGSGEDSDNELTLESFLNYAEKLVSKKFLRRALDRDELEDTEEAKSDFLLTNSKKISTIAANSIKFYELSFNSQTNYIFNASDMLSDKGRTAFYINYAYARLSSILRKLNTAGYTRLDLVKKIREKKCLFIDGETAKWKKARNAPHVDGSYDMSPLDNLLAHLMNFDNVLQTVVSGLDVNLLADFYYNVAILADKWYEQYRCLEYDGDGNVEKIHWSRLAIVELLLRFFDTLNQLLGLEMVDQI